MPRFEPFLGLRYDQMIAPLAEVIAPPYDVVSSEQRSQLADRSPYNAIRVELPSDPGESGDRYGHAANLLDSWEHQGVLRRDDAPTLYVYRMRYTDDDGRKRSTTGVIGALGLDRVGGTEVLPHERTMPKPKGDRLELLRRCATNLSPIWGLSLAEGLAASCIEATEGAPAPMSATDEEGVVHELWPVTDPGAIASISALVATTPIVIADGHHRYETAIFYQAELRQKNGGAPGGHDFVMALIVELSEGELAVQAIHRLVRGLPDDLDLLAELEKYFVVTTFDGDAAALGSALARSGALGLVSAEGNFLLEPTAAVDDAAEADLDSSRLDVALAALPAHDVTYQHGARLAAQAVRRGDAQIAFLLRPATVGQIADTAHSGRRMPPKTTFFHPKPRTGMVFRPVGE